jgi:hypothetical protein
LSGFEKIELIAIYTVAVEVDVPTVRGRNESVILLGDKGGDLSKQRCFMILDVPLSNPHKILYLASCRSKRVAYRNKDVLM